MTNEQAFLDNLDKAKLRTYRAKVVFSTLELLFFGLFFIFFSTGDWLMSSGLLIILALILTYKYISYYSIDQDIEKGIKEIKEEIIQKKITEVDEYDTKYFYILIDQGKTEVQKEIFETLNEGDVVQVHTAPISKKILRIE